MPSYDRRRKARGMFYIFNRAFCPSVYLAAKHLFPRPFLNMRLQHMRSNEEPTDDGVGSVMACFPRGHERALLIYDPAALGVFPIMYDTI